MIRISIDLSNLQLFGLSVAVFQECLRRKSSKVENQESRVNYNEGIKNCQIGKYGIRMKSTIMCQQSEQ